MRKLKSCPEGMQQRTNVDTVIASYYLTRRFKSNYVFYCEISLSNTNPTTYSLTVNRSLAILLELGISIDHNEALTCVPCHDTVRLILVTSLIKIFMYSLTARIRANFKRARANQTVHVINKQHMKPRRRFQLQFHPEPSHNYSSIVGISLSCVTTQDLRTSIFVCVGVYAMQGK